MLVCSRQCGADRDAASVVTAGVLSVGENSAPGCCGKRGSVGFRWVLWVSVARRFRATRDCLLVGGVCPPTCLCFPFLFTQPLYLFPRPSTFVPLPAVAAHPGSLGLPLSLSLSLSHYQKYTGRLPNLCPRNRDYALASSTS